MLRQRLFIHIGVLLVFAEFVPICSQGLVINEFLSSNSTINIDPDFHIYADWIELFNSSTKTYVLMGHFLTDNLNDPEKWEFPHGLLLAPGEFVIVWADSKDTILTGIFSVTRILHGKTGSGDFNGRQPGRCTLYNQRG